MTPGRQPDKIKVVAQAILGFAVHVTPVIDVDDVDTPQVVLDAVDDPVASASVRAQAGGEGLHLLTMSSPEALFAAVLAARPAQPLVTLYDEARGERSELSAWSLGNLGGQDALPAQ